MYCNFAHNKTKTTTMALESIGLLSPEDKLKLKTELEKKAEMINFSISSAQIRKDKALETATNLETESTTLDAEITALDAVIGNLPEGAIKNQMEDKKRAEENKLWSVNKRRANFGTISVVRSEALINELQNRYTVIMADVALLV